METGMRIVLFGLGTLGTKWIPIILKNCIYANIRFVAVTDNDPAKICEWNNRYNIPAISPMYLKKGEFDRILMLVGEKNQIQIRKQLSEQYDISIEIIDTLNEFIAKIQQCNGLGKGKTQNRKRIIYDCFPFYNELDVLEIRLDMLYNHVDKFVIVELNQNHRGVHKDYNLLNNWSRYKRFEDKIIYLRPKDIPHLSETGDWTIENFQRNSIILGLTDCCPDDVIVISDCDEIPNPDVLDALRNENNDLASQNIENFVMNSAVVMEQMYCYYFFNCQHRIKWYGSILVRYENMLIPQLHREMRNILPRIKQGGWHFSYFGSIDQIDLKMNSIVDGINVDRERIIERKNAGYDLYGRVGNEHEMIVIDPSETGIPNIYSLIDRYPEYYKRL